MINLDGQKAVVLVFAMADCPACESYIPRLSQNAAELAQHGHSFAINPDVQPAPGTIPILVYDAASPDPQIQQLADRFGVHATPTTIVAMRGSGSFKVEGSLANNQIQWLLVMATEAAK